MAAIASRQILTACTQGITVKNLLLKKLKMETQNKKPEQLGDGFQYPESAKNSIAMIGKFFLVTLVIGFVVLGAINVFASSNKVAEATAQYEMEKKNSIGAIKKYCTAWKTLANEKGKAAFDKKLNATPSEVARWNLAQAIDCGNITVPPDFMSYSFISPRQ